MHLQHGDLSCLLASARRCCNAHLCEQAISYLEAAAELQPANFRIQYKLGVCYSGACQRHSLTDLPLAHVHFKNALTHYSATDAAPLEKARILGALGNTYSSCNQMPLQARLRAAIDCYTGAASIYFSEQASDDWAREEFNLGNAFSELPPDRYPHKWEDAIVHYENALQIRTKDKDRRAHAVTLQNLGIGLRELSSGNRVANIKRSIGCCRRALALHRADCSTRGVAVVENNLGNSFLSLATVDAEHEARHLQRALRHYDRALAAYSEGDFPVPRTMALFNRGQALLRLAAWNGSQTSGRLHEACECFQTVVRSCERLNLLDLLQTARAQLREFCPRCEQDVQQAKTH